MGQNISQLLSLFFIGAIVVLIVTHSKSFALASGSLFTAGNGLVSVFTGSGTNQ